MDIYLPSQITEFIQILQLMFAKTEGSKMLVDDSAKMYFLMALY